MEKHLKRLYTHIFYIFVVCCCLVTKSCLTLQSHGLQHTRLPWPPLYIYIYIYTRPGGSEVKNLPAVEEIEVRFQGWEDPLEEGTAAHSSILTWSIPWTEEPGRLQSIRLQRQTWLKRLSTAHTHTHTHTHAHTHTHIYIYDPLCCTPETNIALWINSTSIKKEHLFNEIMECLNFGTSCINKCRCVHTHTHTILLQLCLTQTEHSLFEIISWWEWAQLASVSI